MKIVPSSWFALSCVSAILLSTVGVFLSLPWDRGDASSRIGLLQTFATWSALAVAVPAGWAAWRAYRLATVRVPIKMSLEGRGPEFDEPLTIFFENPDEAPARGFLIQLNFNPPVNAEDLTSVWLGAEHAYLHVADTPPNLDGATYFFTEPFGQSGREILAQLSLDQAEVLLPGSPSVWVISWSVRGGNVIPGKGKFCWSPSDT